MLNVSQNFKDRITGDTRKVLVRAIMDIIDPDIVYGAVGGSPTTAYSIPAQLHDSETDLAPYATLEDNRWVLDGTFDLAHTGMTQEVAWESNALATSANVLNVSLTLAISGVDLLQALTLYWPSADYNGVGEDFTVEVQSGGVSYYTNPVTGNADPVIVMKDFTVYNPDLILITITRWSLPYRRARVPEIFCGLREEWDNDRLAEFSVRQQADFSCVTLPFGTATLTIDNSTREFEPRAKNNLFASLEERQGVKLSIGVEGAEYVPLGTYYQYAAGWKTSSNALTMQWDLVDIVGLLVDRQFVAPTTLPTTLEGWISCIVGQLGATFVNAYKIDPNYASLPMTALSADVFADKTCGQVLLWCCQAAGIFPRADAETGKLAVEPFWSQGNAITLDNIENYPTMAANKDIAFVRFTLPDSSVITVQGTSISSPNTVEISNPFIQTQEAAARAAKEIISIYGGNTLQTLGRGDPSSEVGDVPTVQLDRSSATTGRIYYQEFVIQDGVMQGCATQMLQADGAANYSAVETFTEDGTWSAPQGVTEVKIILVGGGSGGQNGGNGSLNVAGQDGADGLGGKVYSSVININPGQSFAITIGQGATYGTEPTATTFGIYTSEDGHSYIPSYTDVQSGAALGRTGVADPVGNGDGGKGGAGGLAGTGHAETTTRTVYMAYPNNGEPFEMDAYSYNALQAAIEQGGIAWDGYFDVYQETTTRFVYDTYPTNGGQGVGGADGVCIVYYDR